MIPVRMRNENASANAATLLSHQGVTEILDAATAVENEELFARKFQGDARGIAAILERLVARDRKRATHAPEFHVDMIVQNTVYQICKCLRVKGFADVAIGAELESALLVKLIGFRRNHDKPHARQVGSLADAFA